MNNKARDRAARRRRAEKRRRAYWPPELLNVEPEQPVELERPIKWWRPFWRRLWAFIRGEFRA